MTNLEDRIWLTAHGGYRIPYNASLPLRKLRDASRPDEFGHILTELWDNLHHQGDVGLASYLAIPHIVSIGIERRSLDWKFIGLCTLIENCRIDERNPEIPPEYQDLYFDSLKELEKYLLLNFKNITDQTSLRLALALFATLNGQPDLGKAIGILDEDVARELVKR